MSQQERPEWQKALPEYERRWLDEQAFALDVVQESLDAACVERDAALAEIAGHDRHSEIMRARVNEMRAERDAARAQVAELREALEEIAAGHADPDRLEEVARDALAALDNPGETT